MVGHEGAALAALFPAGCEHEVLHHQLATAIEQFGQRARALRRVERVGRVHAHPWQGTTFAGDLVVQAGEFFLAREQGEAGGAPGVAGNEGRGVVCEGVHGGLLVGGRGGERRHASPVPVRSGTGVQGFG